MLYNDLISREALKEYVKKVEDYESAYTICAYIDDAPTAFFPLIVRVNDKVTDEHIEILKQLMKDYKPQVLNLEIEKTPDWIPIKTRPLTEEEKQNAIEKHDIDPDDLKYPFAWHFDCELPEPKEGEQSVDVLVTTDLGFVKVTNFFIDYLGCPCFEDMDEAGEFVAWMPLPERYESEV